MICFVLHVSFLIVYLHECVVEVPIERLLDVADVLDLSDSANRDLFALVSITLDRHDCFCKSFTRL